MTELRNVKLHPIGPDYGKAVQSCETPDARVACYKHSYRHIVRYDSRPANIKASTDRVFSWERTRINVTAEPSPATNVQTKNNRVKLSNV
jgi:hypothetical protein